ncbi:NAD(P)-dependent alcohol dehydrogenase, partial [Nocardioides sp.]|uniref:NAD(P)-dependent alcohol dehydrogenase n=1 Tax=Nocardioides sp. TaxID=35761 RepID=UPI0035613551
PGWHSKPVLSEVPEPEPGPGQVVIQVGGAGVCHSDLHLMSDFESGQLPWEPPFTLGHENAGWVHRVGAGVHGFEPGQPVAVTGAWGCGTCARCRDGVEIYCENLAEAPVPGGGGGLGLDGGMADFMLVHDSRFLVPLPDGLDPVHAAPLTDAGLTPYHAIKRSLAKLTPDATAVVIGAGGLGHMAVQILKVMSSAAVIVVDPLKAARDLALSVGADVALEPGEELVATIREHTRGRGADLVLDLVGSDSTLADAAGMTRSLGDLTIVGIAGGTLPVSFFSQAYEVSIQTTYWGTRHELGEVLELAARKLIAAEVHPHPLEDGPEVYRQLRAGEIAGRAVLQPSMLYDP